MTDLELALEMAKEAGAILLDGRDQLGRLEVDFKSARDPVSEIDRASESHVRSRIAAHRPDDAILGEEGGGGEDRAGRLWIVDPLDGTVNFLRGFPAFAVSIALVEDGEPTVGVVHAPALEETFHAARDQGAYLGTKRLAVSTEDGIGASLLATGFAYNRSETGQNNLDNFHRLCLAAQGIRRIGAAALDLSWVAAGRFDGFWELFLAPWDVAAGALIVREAGGRVTAFDGGKDWLFGKNIVASNGLIHDQITQRLTPFQGTRDQGLAAR